MAFSVQMPELGESVTEGTITRWLKQEGDTVEVDEPLVEVSTDKVDTEIPSPAAGVLQKIVAAEDETVEIGAELAVIGDKAKDDDDDDAPVEGSSDVDETPSDEAQDAPEETTQPEATEPASGAEPEATEPEPDEATEQPPSSGSGEGTPVTMPALGESVTEGTVTRWLKSVGDEVTEDEPLLEVSTDKVDTEIPSPTSGTLLEILADEDETVEVGAPLAMIGSSNSTPSASASAPEQAPAAQPEEQGEPGTAERAEQEDETPLEEEAESDAAAREQTVAAEDAEKPAHEAPKEQAPEEPAQAPENEQSAPTDSAGSNVPYVTPLVRRLATDQSVDLAEVKGTGVGGRIRKQDVEAAAEAARAAAKPKEADPVAPAAARSAPATAAGVRPELSGLRGTTKKATRIRQITATKTRESLQTTAQLTQTFEVDMSRVAALRARAKAQFQEREGVNLTYLPFFAKAVVEALKSHPNVNASYDEGAKEITYHGSEHLSIAVDTEAGLLSPVIHQAGDLSLAGLARAIVDLASRARSNGLKPDELSGGTFTITNIGSQGALFDTPILVPPQAAMLGTGAIVKRPVVVTDSLGGDTIAIRSMCFLPMTYDHRLVDGADAGRFLTTVKQRLEEAAFEADLGL